MNSRSIYVGVALLFAGCSTVTPTPKQRTLLDIVSNHNQRYFTETAKKCLSESPILVKRYWFDGIYSGHYNPFTETRSIDIQLLDGDPKKRPDHLEDTEFHESLHRMLACRLFNPQKFLELYNNIDEKEYPIKKEVEDLIENESIFGRDTHRLIYTVQLWKMDGYDLPERMKDYFKSVIRIDEGPLIMKGLIGTEIKPLKE